VQPDIAPEIGAVTEPLPGLVSAQQGLPAEAQHVVPADGVRDKGPRSKPTAFMIGCSSVVLVQCHGLGACFPSTPLRQDAGVYWDLSLQLRAASDPCCAYCQFACVAKNSSLLMFQCHREKNRSAADCKTAKIIAKKLKKEAWARKGPKDDQNEHQRNQKKSTV